MGAAEGGVEARNAEDGSSDITSFGLSQAHVDMRAVLRRFVDREVCDLARVAEEKEEFPRQLIPMLAEHDLLGIKYPVSLGGQGLDIICECLLIEELTRASAGISAGVFAHAHLSIAPIIYFGDEEQREQFAAPALRGEYIGAFALTEPGAGSDVRGLQTSARQDAGSSDFRLNGSKVFITNGSIADYLLVAAYLEPGESSDRSIAMFVIPGDTPGLERRPMKKLGNRSSDTAEVFIDDVRVPQSALLGTRDAGFKQLVRTLTEGRILVSTRGLALAEDAYERALAYAKERRAFGHAISRYQAISHRLAQLDIEIDAARLLIYRAARLAMAGKDATIAASKAKFAATTLAQRATTQALHMHGGWGYTPEYGVERLYRDAPESVIGEGTAEIQLRIIARSLGLDEF
ncbi:MAG: acyl-CoA dehydrogenase [Acidimicrobiia bacterium]|nr:acyl-CoA dehydrogenase [Acidimicrobiia bacterium]